MNIAPINIDGQEWPYLSTNLAITSRYLPDGTMDASVSARFVPTRIDNGDVKTLPEKAMTFFRGSLRELRDQSEADAMTAIRNALEAFVAAKLNQP
jgi:hypothetical protein